MSNRTASEAVRRPMVALAQGYDIPHEAGWLGIDPSTLSLRQGPLIVSALGADPPERSVHFHLSLMSLQDGTIELARPLPAAEQVAAVLDEARRLNTKLLTLVPGEGENHGLVWENGSTDLHTLGAIFAAGHSLKESLPEGDGEVMLRRYIDDSINLLGSLPFNEERIDQGLPSLNLLWPWGPGFRERAPNLLLERGERAWVESGSLRMQGLARLVGYRHGDRNAFGQGTNVRLERLVESARKHDPTIMVMDGPGFFRATEKFEELEWMGREMDSRLFSPLLDDAKNDRLRIVVLSPAWDRDGLGMWFESGMPAENTVPFDERALEGKLEVREAWKVVRSALNPR
ncbi:MAG: hypothetical protein WAO58_10665 [Fimbriimonadaceae bacterium]